ncbi:MAG: hypothetical protein JNL21_20605 [Myxococcales bacterium]|nr:hypothetical protein [Myxococcales bacterium]
MKTSSLFFVAAILPLAGCPADETAGIKGGPTSSVPTGSTTTTASPTAKLGEDATGVATCDAYIAKMRACIDKLPEADRDARKKALDGSLATFRDQAKQPDTRANLEITCAAASAALDADPLCK